MSPASEGGAGLACVCLGERPAPAVLGSGEGPAAVTGVACTDLVPARADAAV